MKNFLKILAIFFVNSFMIAILMLILALVINFSFVQIGKTIDSNHHREVQTVKKATVKFLDTTIDKLEKYANEPEECKQ